VRAVSGLVERCQSAAGLKVVIVRKRWVGGKLATQVLNCEVSFLMVCLMGGMAMRKWRGMIGVVLKHPEIFRTVSFWAVWRMSRMPLIRLWDE